LKAFLRAILEFMDRKWPDKVELTLVQYKELEERMKKIENQINQHNVALGFMPNVGKVPVGGFQR